MTPEERVEELDVYAVVRVVEVKHIVRKAMQDCANICDGVQKNYDDGALLGNHGAGTCADLIRKEIAGEGKGAVNTLRTVNIWDVAELFALVLAGGPSGPGRTK